MRESVVRPLAGLATVTAIAAVIAGSVALFRGAGTTSTPVTVISPRAGLVMDVGAKVKLRDIVVGRVASISPRPDGTAALELAIEPAQTRYIPANVAVGIASITVFGAKYVELQVPSEPSEERIRAGQVLQGSRVTVEVNTLFEQLTTTLREIEPAHLNETLGALAEALNGRGERFGQVLSNLHAFLQRVNPSLPALSHNLEVLPGVVNTYADAAPDLSSIAHNGSVLSQLLVDQDRDLDVLLISAIGLARTGTEVLDDHGTALSHLFELLVPTTSLLSEYSPAINCGIAGILPFAQGAPQQDPGVTTSIGFTLGVERYRYPHDLPKVAARGGPQCASQSLPLVPPGVRPPFVVMDNGSNPAQYGNQGILLNSDALKQHLFGPLDGPPRNTAQIGQPG
ncbi:MCE family protein [Mycobacterium sp. ACS4331]|uniref:MCE family protein n=1 Tax=Mycobacterium sp. ACS4331 TaxID=1834121 RepID=UPI0007FF79BD|nr:MCE family protein [Mycobacterium sp. ACS4331]OBF24838.1 MCE-family protein [Mycobacterium sp. ACS4331]